MTLLKVAPGATPDPDTGNFEADETAFAFGDTVAFVSNQFGSDSEVEIVCDNADLEAFLGLAAAQQQQGTDADVELDLDSSFKPQATLIMDGNKARVTDANGFEMTFMLDEGLTGDVNMKVTDIGTMTLQIGANEHQTMDVKIPEVSSKTLYLDEIDVRKVDGGDRAIVSLDNALAITTSVRSAIGAYQNRLDYAVEGLDASNEDMTNAISRLSDVDMAKEMSEYTKYNVLQQAGTSVLAQANDIPQTVLQLLQ